MVRYVSLLVLALLVAAPALNAQTKAVDSLHNALNTAKEDTNKVNLLCNLAWECKTQNPARSIALSRQALALGDSLHYPSGSARALHSLGYVYWLQGIFDRSLDYHLQSLKLRENIADSQGIALSLHSLSQVYLSQGKYSEAEPYRQKALSLARSLQDSSLIGRGINALGVVYFWKKQYDSALIYFHQALSIRERLREFEDMGISSGNIAWALCRTSRYEEALPFATKALEIGERYGYKRTFAFSCIVLAEIYEGKRQYTVAEHYAENAITVARSIGIKEYIRWGLERLASIAANAGNYKRAVEYFRKYKDFSDSIFTKESADRTALLMGQYLDEQREKELLTLKKDAENQAIVRNSLLGGVGLLGVLAIVVVRSLRQQRKATVVITASRERLEVMSEVGRSLTSSLVVETITTSLYERVAEVMDATVFGIGLYRREKEELEYKIAMERGTRYKPYVRSILDKEQFPIWCLDNCKHIFINDVANEYSRYLTVNPFAKRELELATLDDNSEIQKPHSMLYVPLLLEGSPIGVLSVQSYVRNAYSQEDLDTLQTLANYAAIAIANAESTEEIIRQKAIVEEFNRNTQDSIRYAKRIQDAMLPSTETLNRLLPEHFIFFRPKDVVSGDFYWCKEVQGKVFVAAVDCTGHGVPGAFMSLIGNALLNDITQRLPDPHPDVILNELHRELQTVLRQKETNNDDGMDMCLCMIDKQTRIVEFAGAMSPLYAVVAGELREFKGTPEELGGREERSPVYALHLLDLSNVPEGLAMLYLTTDGYKDQYNDARQRFMPKRLRPLLAEIARKPLQEQPRLLGEAIDTHKGDTMQVDDMLVLGVKL